MLLGKQGFHSRSNTYASFLLVLLLQIEKKKSIIGTWYN
jgi:hypothetical protein